MKIGLAIGADVVTAVWQSAAGEPKRWSCPIDPPGPLVEALHRALNELRAELGDVIGVQVAVVLLPPLVRMRRIPLPPMSDDDARTAISRAASKYFLGISEPVICSVKRVARRGPLADSVLAVAAASSIVDDVTAAVRGVGWRLDRIVPAHAAWLDEILRRWPDTRRGNSAISVAGATETTVLMVDDGQVALARRRRSEAIADPVIEPETRRCRRLTETAIDAAEIAAASASRTASFELIADAVRRTDARRAHQVSSWLIAASVLCILGAAAAYRVGLTLQLRAIDRERAVLKARVERALASRDSLTSLAATIKAVDALERSAPRWSATIGQVARALPDDASLGAFRADGDSASLEGQAKDAARVFTALRAAQGIVAVRPTAPVRQESSPGQPPVERWVLMTRVNHAATTGNASR
jgi:hypothetical protein